MFSQVENASLSPTGTFDWTPVGSSSNQESMFEISMHDKCGFSASATFVVAVCKCDNGEVCVFVNGSSFYECVVPVPSSGK